MTEPTFPYIYVGEITKKVAAEAHIQSGHIYMSMNQVKHIRNTHKKELGIVGMTPMDYVRFVCQNFNQIRERKNDGYMLVVYNQSTPNTAIIELNFALNIKRGFWEIKTAEPRRNSAVKKSALIWEAAKHTSNGSGTHPN